MRIWSKKLVISGALPTKQLKSMRYELGDVIKQYPNIKHPLVKFANNYDIVYLGEYFIVVCKEFDKRFIKHNATYDSKILSIIAKQTNIEYGIDVDEFGNCYTSLDHLQFDEDNEEYLKICYWNLYEKHLRKMISEEEW